MTVCSNLPKEWIESKGLLNDNIIGDINKGESTKCILTHCEPVAFVSQIEPKNVNDVINDSNWVIAMQDELNQFTRHDVWSLVPRSDNTNVISTKWVS